jgi:hypothetical protein
MNYLYQNIVSFWTYRKAIVPSSGTLFSSFDFALVKYETLFPALNILRFRVKGTVDTSSALV